VASELPEQRCAAERERTADDGDDRQLEDAEREDAGAAHKTVINRQVFLRPAFPELKVS